MENPDKVIFLGDYFDPYDLSLISDMYDNFRNILKYKEEHNDNCILIFGNHDYHYIFGNTTCTRYSMTTYDCMANTLSNSFHNGILQLAYQDNNIIFTHAGISNYWLTKVAKLSDKNFTADDINNVDIDLFDFNNITNKYDCYGNSISQSPIWIRPEALLEDPNTKYTQIVGHTRVLTPCCEKNIWFNDAIMKKGYIIINGTNIEPKTYINQKN